MHQLAIHHKFVFWSCYKDKPNSLFVSRTFRLQRLAAKTALSAWCLHVSGVVCLEKRSWKTATRPNSRMQEKRCRLDLIMTRTRVFSAPFFVQHFVLFPAFFFLCVWFCCSPACYYKIPHHSPCICSRSQNKRNTHVCDTRGLLCWRLSIRSANGQLDAFKVELIAVILWMAMNHPSYAYSLEHSPWYITLTIHCMNDWYTLRLSLCSFCTHCGRSFPT